MRLVRWLLSLVRSAVDAVASRRCPRHDIPYRSDFCPACVREREVLQETRERWSGIRHVQ